jgi:ABC-2 type transport system permease protein
MLRIYQRMWQVNWAEQWQYRANLLMYLLYWLVSPIIYLAVWTTVAQSQGTVSGLTANDFVTYYLTLLIVDNLTSQITIHILAYKIQDGTLSSELLKPVHPILTNTLMNNLAFKALNFMALIPIWIILYLLFRPDFSTVTAQSLLL